MVITGGDEIFCAGADISEMGGDPNAESSYHHAREFQILFDQVESLPQPVIAAVSGYALGGGCELALAADFRIASETRALRSAGNQNRRLSRRRRHAKIDPFDRRRQSQRNDSPRRSDHGRAGARLGLVMKVAPKDKYMAEAMELAAKLAALPRLALQASKMLINRSQDIDLATGLEFEARTFGAIAHSHDLAEGTRAFLEKRKPNFTGH